jgi:hypothetical protein
MQLEWIPMFRHALLLVGGTVASREQCEAALGKALRALLSRVPVRDLGAQIGTRDAMDGIMFETAGQA